jgi:hypothetical protein
MFWQCPTATFDATCSALASWQPDLQMTYDRSSAAQYAVVEVEAANAAGTSAAVASAPKLVTIPPTLSASGIHLTRRHARWHCSRWRVG